MNKTLRALALLLLLPASLPAAEPPKPTGDPFSATSDEIRGWIKTIQGTRRLPIAGMSLAQVGDRMMLMSDNGRFAVVGNFRLVDVWNAIEVKTLADGDKLSRIDLKRIGVRDGDLAQLVYGSGPKQVFAFVDPYCRHCHGLISQMESLKAEYTFHLILTPVLGKDSVDMVKKLACYSDKAKALDALISQKYDAIPAPGQCDLSQLQKTLITTRLLGIDGVPYLILPSTQSKRGGTNNLKELLENDARG